MFALPGDVPLGELAAFYGLSIPARFATTTAAQLFDQRFDEQAQVGDRLTPAARRWSCAAWRTIASRRWG